MERDVSVIIPHRNRVQYIAEAVQSVLSTRDFEAHVADIIIVDDGSTLPETRQVLEKLRDQNPEVIHLHFLEKRSGQSAARNFGIARCAGSFILPLDDDDKIHPDYIPKALSVLKQDQGIALVYCLAEYFGAKQGEWALPGFDMPSMLIRNRIFNSALYRKGDWLRTGGYDESLSFWEDWDLWLKILSTGKKVHRLDGFYFYYRQHELELSVSKGMDKTKRTEGYRQLVRNNMDLYRRYFPGIEAEALVDTLLIKRQELLGFST